MGDTFDYKDSYSNNENIPYGPYFASVEYSRYSVGAVYYSTDSAVKYIQRIRLYPPPALMDTLVLSNLSVYEIYLDTLCFPNNPGNVTIDSVSSYGGIINTMSEGGCTGPDFQSFSFVAGLGKVDDLREKGCGRCHYLTGDEISLVYYAKGNQRWGKPYTYLLASAGLNSLPSNGDAINLFPTVNDGNFIVKITDVSLLPVNLEIYDVMGRQINQLDLNEMNNTVNLSSVSTGTYIWKVSRKGEVLKTGKMILH